ncbi:hypothetical protein UlMin_015311 [Ulmus minor]
MGNYRFRLSDMMPNAWFYKLKDMSKTRNQKKTTRSTKKKHNTITSNTQHKPQLSHQGYTYRTDRFSKSSESSSSNIHFPDPPRRSSKRIPRRKAFSRPSHRQFDSSWSKSKPVLSPDYFDCPCESSSEHDEVCESISSDSDSYNVVSSNNFVGLASWSSSCNCRVSSSTADIIIDLNGEASVKKTEKFDGFDVVSELELPPILTKPVNFEDNIMEATKYKARSSPIVEEAKGHESLSFKSIIKEESVTKRKEQKGIRLRPNSPRLASKKMQAFARKSVSSNASFKSKNRHLSESFAVVKSSIDPQGDFRDSMVEMIVENNIRASNDLEELLACYLSLNSKEYHDHIVKAFEQIWFDMANIRL